MNAARQTYKYSPLPSFDSSIRLLRIRSGTDEPIRCSLEIVHLKDRPLYDCLSYTWGDPLYHDLSAPEDRRPVTGQRTIPIYCDGLAVLVTKNLHDVLRELVRDKRSSRQVHQQDRIWIDAVCINQEDTLEKDHQVNIMGQIYSKAQTVIVWLGIYTRYTDTAIDVLNQLLKIPERNRDTELFGDLNDAELYEDLGIPYIEPWQWLHLGAFLRRTWFQRIWVVQEAFVARKIAVLCGSRSLDWGDITRVSKILRNTELGRLLDSKVEDAIDGKAEYRRSTMSNLFIFEILREKAGELNLETLLAYSRYFNATNKRDHVYAVFGMLKTQLFPVNYRIEVEEVYKRASLVIIREMGDLNVLSLVEDSSARRHNALPSWVPDYSVTALAEPLSGNPRAKAGKKRWKASDGLKWEIPEETASSRSLLSVRGVQFGSITEFASTEAGIVDHHQIGSLLSILRNFLEQQHPSSGGRRPIDAFWRTLIKDTFRGQPAGREAPRGFPMFFSDHIAYLKFDIERIQNSDDSNVDRKKLNKLTSLHTETEELISVLSTKGINDIIPTRADIQELEDKVPNGVPSDDEREINYVSHSLFEEAYRGRRLFRTDGNYLGIGPESLQKGDQVWVIAGATVPMILRKSESGHWRLVGEAYVHGIMNGEAVNGDGQMIMLE
ncbi:Heterokaryon incompatibility protein (HET) domain containing protein [Elaphomyces granulatus]